MSNPSDLSAGGIQHVEPAASPLALFRPFPTIETERLLLRALREDDLDDLYEGSSDPEMARLVAWDHYGSLEEAREDLAGYLEQYDGPLPDQEPPLYASPQIGVWGIEHRAERKLIGICNFTYWRPRHRRAEIGYAIGRRFQGQGLATEAARALIAFGFERMGLLRAEATCLPENTGSRRVMERAGMEYEGLLRNAEIWRGEPKDLVMYAVVRSGPA